MKRDLQMLCFCIAGLALMIILVLFFGCEVTPAPASLGTAYDGDTFEQALRRIDSLRLVTPDTLQYVDVTQ